MYISIHSLHSVLCWSSLGSIYRLYSIWVWSYKLGTTTFSAVYPSRLYRPSLAPAWSISAQPFSVFSRNVQSDWNRAIHRHLQDFLRTSLLSSVCLGLLSRLNFGALWSRLSRMSLYIAAFICPSTLTSFPVATAEKQPHCVMLPPPCFTVEVVLARGWAVPGFLQPWCSALRPKSLIFVLSLIEALLPHLLRQPALIRVLVVSHFHLSMTCSLCSLAHSMLQKCFCTVSFPRSVPQYYTVYRQFLGLNGLLCALTCTVKDHLYKGVYLSKSYPIS